MYLAQKTSAFHFWKYIYITEDQSSVIKLTVNHN